MALHPSKPYGQLGKAPSAQSEMLQKMARKAPYYKRNLPHVCSFWVKGECKRGEECPYRHETPTDPDDPLSVQNIKDRYYGINDPVADKLVKRYQEVKREEKDKIIAASAPKNPYLNNDEDNSKKMTPGLPPVLQAPKVDISNDFFNLTPYSLPPPPPPPPQKSSKK